MLSGEIDREVAANGASNRHDFLVLLDQALKRRAAGVDDATSTQPEQAPDPDEEPMPELRVARPATE